MGEPTPSRFGETPTPKRLAAGAGGGRSRWDDKTPIVGGITPSTFAGFTPNSV